MSITLFTLLVLCAGPTLGLLVPQHLCDGHFSYFYKQEEQTYIGIFTAPTFSIVSSNAVLNWRATFEIEGKRDLFVGPMKTYPNENDAATKIGRGMPAETFVEFVNITTALPKLISFYINNMLVCSSAEYQYPKTRVTVRHHMTLSVKNKRPSPKFQNSGGY
ncbi:LOW QUALITY PROTEIN: uncharacterized protein LOC120453026 [Drosophila santomea]|uniref:LOW QUALITY PROTEIN: uncharacterized protein LOC120453026 n=1 Tax=Drosophila santomea TaxID=129105 RepID=UPI001954551F|nr:LOW QUALITY PROTEIN: uncharacterized protein LOC120453026 [Drosophila santomea]